MRALLFLIISVLIFSVLGFSCRNKVNAEFRISKPVQIVCTKGTLIDSVIYEFIKKYISDNPKIKSYVLEFKTFNDSLGLRNGKGYLLGPSYYDPDSNNTPLFYLEVYNKPVFIKCGIERLFKTTTEHRKKYIESSIKRNEDSLNLIGFGTIRNREVLFMKRAIFIFKENNDSISVNNRPDTLFMPSYTGNVIKFHAE